MKASITIAFGAGDKHIQCWGRMYLVLRMSVFSAEDTRLVLRINSFSTEDKLV